MRLLYCATVYLFAVILIPGLAGLARAQTPNPPFGVVDSLTTPPASKTLLSAIPHPLGYVVQTFDMFAKSDLYLYDDDTEIFEELYPSNLLSRYNFFTSDDQVYVSVYNYDFTEFDGPGVFVTDHFTDYLFGEVYPVTTPTLQTWLSFTQSTTCLQYPPPFPDDCSLNEGSYTKRGEHLRVNHASPVIFSSIAESHVFTTGTLTDYRTGEHFEFPYEPIDCLAFDNKSSEILGITKGDRQIVHFADGATVSSGTLNLPGTPNDMIVCGFLDGKPRGVWRTDDGFYGSTAEGGEVHLFTCDPQFPHYESAADQVTAWFDENDIFYVYMPVRFLDLGLHYAYESFLLASCSPNGQWRTMIPNVPTFLSSDISVHPGISHLVYSDADGVHYVTIQAGFWDEQIVDADGTNGRIWTENGKPTISYAVNEYTQDAAIIIVRGEPIDFIKQQNWYLR